MSEAKEITEEKLAAKKTAANTKVNKKKTNSLEAEVNEMKQLAQRVQADFENYKKRVAKEREEILQRSTEQLLNDLLPIVDSFEQANSSISQEEETALSKGLKLVQTQFNETLNKYGVEEISTEQPFNPDFHEAVISEGDGSLEHPVIVDTLRKGYTVHGRVLRPAMVKVNN
jgi:molecular chaperone GrpE